MPNWVRLSNIQIGLRVKNHHRKKSASERITFESFFYKSYVCCQHPRRLWSRMPWHMQLLRASLCPDILEIHAGLCSWSRGLSQTPDQPWDQALESPAMYKKPKCLLMDVSCRCTVGCCPGDAKSIDSTQYPDYRDPTLPQCVCTLLA